MEFKQNELENKTENKIEDKPKNESGNETEKELENQLEYASETEDIEEPEYKDTLIPDGEEFLEESAETELPELKRELVPEVIECLLFVSGEPVLIKELCRVLSMTELELRPLIIELASEYESSGRGLLLYLTEDSVQLISNRAYAPYVEELLQPKRTKTFSQAMMETLTIVAYRQPITRTEIDFIRGVRSEYSINQLIKQELIAEVGRKDVVGHPQLLGTTDKFLRRFGLHTLAELPDYEKLSDPEMLNESEEQ